MSSFTLPFLMGFTLSLHCAGMCGPIMLVLPFSRFSGFHQFLAVVLYHIARITAYACMALILFSFKNLFNPKIQQYVSISLGIVLFCAAILSFIPLKNIQIKLPWAAGINKYLSAFLKNPGLAGITGAGFLNGLLPCGLVYVALSAAISGKTTGDALRFIYIFGLGTLPILLAFTFLKGRAGSLTSKIFSRQLGLKRLMPVLVFFFGCIFFLRGLNLGIPYLSPKVEVTGKTVKSCCCHKK